MTKRIIQWHEEIEMFALVALLVGVVVFGNIDTKPVPKPENPIIEQYVYTASDYPGEACN